MPKYSMSEANRQKLAATSSSFTNPVTVAIDGVRVTAGQQTTTLVWLDTSDGFITKDSNAPYFNPILVDTVKAVTDASLTTPVEVEIPWYDGEQTIKVTNQDATPANTCKIAFNAADATDLTLAGGESYEITLPARLIHKVFIEAAANRNVRVLATVSAPSVQ